MPHALDHSANTYLAVSLTPSSTYLSNPPALANVHPALTHLGPVGELPDVQLLSVPKVDWENVKDGVLGSLKDKRGEGVVDVEVQMPRTRAKRGGDEL